MAIYKPGRPSKFYPTLGRSQKPPAKPGEYRIRSESGAVLYIGETNNLARRTSEHMRNGKLSDKEGCLFMEYMVADSRSTSRTRRIHEQASIRKHCPLLNRSKGGEGRPAGK